MVNFSRGITPSFFYTKLFKHPMLYKWNITKMKYSEWIVSNTHFLSKLLWKRTTMNLIRNGKPYSVFLGALSPYFLYFAIQIEYFLYDRKIWKIFRRILLSRWRRCRPNTFSFHTLTLVKVNRNLWNFNTRFRTTKGRLGLIFRN